MNQHWKSLGRLAAPNPDIGWMATCTGAACAVARNDSSVFDIYVTGRDDQNRSLIGRLAVDLHNPLELLEISPDPVLGLGDLGAFDENGVSYPCLVKHRDSVRLYYTGWMPSVLTPFQNHAGLAIQGPDELFLRHSRAPILERTNDDYLSIGSVYVIHEKDRWLMWYTAFRRWWREGDAVSHEYVIKFARSQDGICWERRNQVAIDVEHPGEHSIARPSVLVDQNGYHMWYCYRGDEYRIGYARSRDGEHWKRQDDHFEFTRSGEAWDTDAITYPHVFRFEDQLYMLYCGNRYGRDGLGLATISVSEFEQAVVAD